MQIKERTIWFEARPRTWYAMLDKYLSKLGFIKATRDGNLYLRKNDDGLFIIVIFVDDIIFEGNDKESDKFAKQMKNEFEMSMIEEMKFFLGL